MPITLPSFTANPTAKMTLWLVQMTNADGEVRVFSIWETTKEWATFKADTLADAFRFEWVEMSVYPAAPGLAIA